MTTTASPDLGPDPAEWPYGHTWPDGDLEIHTGAVWVQVTPQTTCGLLPEQGWKLHVSARPSTCAATFRAAAEVLVRHRVTFKVARTGEVLRAINDGFHGAATIGKFITAYPAPEEVRDLGHALAEALVGNAGPRIASDRQVRADSPVYYRYGPFVPRYRTDEDGRIALGLLSPKGEMWSGAAQEHFVEIPWAVDPFRPSGEEGQVPPRPLLVAGRYAVSGAISRSPRGATYRAVDRQDDRPVIVKHARAYVNESRRGDARAYLRSERAALRHFAGINGIPSVVDHFRTRQDEFLVLTDLGGSDLRFDVLNHGLYAHDGPGPRTCRVIGRELLGILDEVHAAGAVARDIAPKNVIVLDDGGYALVDFEISDLGGGHQFGWSPGYSSDTQRRDADAHPADDLYSLGATLFYSVTGIDPFIDPVDGTADMPATLQCLGEITGYGSNTYCLVAGLMADSEQERKRASHALRCGLTESAPIHPAPITHDMPERALREARSAAGAAAKSLLAQVEQAGPPLDLTAQSGVAGLLAELAHHPELHEQGVKLAHYSARASSTLGPGLMFGRTGLAVSIHQLATQTGDPDLLADARLLLPSPDDVERLMELDVARGVAGVALGAMATGVPRLVEACASRLRAQSADWPRQAAALPSSQKGHAISIANGLVHGQAGIAYVNLLVDDAQDGGAPTATRASLESLRTVALDLAEQAGQPTARPMAASWCQGLAGMGAVLVRAGAVLGEPDLVNAAIACAAVGYSLAARCPAVGECCGIAGMGELAIDLSLATGDTSHLVEARRLLDLVLRRAHLATFPEAVARSTATSVSFGWGSGVAGILGFARRINDPSTGRHWMADESVPIAALGVDS